jgi:hypothetical protein
MADKKQQTSGDKSYEGCYGEISKPSEVKGWLVRLSEDNIAHQDKGHPRWAGCIWGHPGVGKTSLARDLSTTPVSFRGKEYPGYAIAYVPLAQIEEMGDIHGVPEDFILMSSKVDEQGNVAPGSETKWVMAKDVVMTTYLERGWHIPANTRTVTKTCPPDWVPTEERPGILILDDANRASIRIMKGIMQLMQDYRTIGWEMPAGWTIVCTGNPDMQTYLVTTVDDAVITRQRHITMRTDAKEWAIWASQHKVDPRGINFLLKYPEMMVGVRTNPRTLTEFFRCLERHPDITATPETRKAVMVDGKSLIDEETVISFMTFATRDMGLVIEPERILNDADSVLPELKRLMAGKEARIDIVSVTCDRLYAFLAQPDYKVQPQHVVNFQKFIMTDDLENDMRHSLLKRMAVCHDKPELKTFMLKNNAILKFVGEALRMSGTL